MTLDKIKTSSVGYERTQMQKDIIIEKLREQGCRITKQRLVLLDIILSEECSCCKEIYYNASKLDSRIGSATVYRMINTLEEIGAISRKNMYKVACGENCMKENGAINSLMSGSGPTVFGIYLIQEHNAIRQPLWDMVHIEQWATSYWLFAIMIGIFVCLWAVSILLYLFYKLMHKIFISKVEAWIFNFCEKIKSVIIKHLS